MSNLSYTQIINFWIPDEKYHQKWFKPNPKFDKYIYDNYNKYIDYFLNKSEYIFANEILSGIIVLDQFSRNIGRIKLLEYNKEQLNRKATSLSIKWIEKNYYITEPISYTIFALMPLRHTFQLKYYKVLINILEEIKEIYITNKVFSKFYFHTYRCYKSLL